MKTIIKKLLAHYWLVYPVLILKMFIYYWQTKRLDMLSIYDVPLLSLLFLFCVFEAFSFKESKPRRYGFYIVYTLITLIMLADAAYSSYFGKYVSVNQLYQITSLGQIAGDGDVIGARLTILLFYIGIACAIKVKKECLMNWQSAGRKSFILKMCGKKRNLCYL